MLVIYIVLGTKGGRAILGFSVAMLGLYMQRREGKTLGRILTGFGMLLCISALLPNW